MDLKNAARVPLEKDDRFAAAMGPFSVEARSQCNIMLEMFKKMETLYTGLESYYVFEKQKYNLEEFMSDIKKFKDQFKEAYSKIIRDREAADKLIRAKEAREKQEMERAERAAKKRALVDFNAPDDQEGVMDSLLEALKTGSAFNREQKRKRPPRAAGAERRAQLNRSRSRGPNGMTLFPTRDIVDILNDAENDTAMALGESENKPESNTVAEVRTRRNRPPRPKSAHLNIGREREFTFQGSSLLTNGDLAALEKNLTMSNKAKNGNNNSSENDALLRKLRAL